MDLNAIEPHKEGTTKVSNTPRMKHLEVLKDRSTFLIGPLFDRLFSGHISLLV